MTLCNLDHATKISDSTKGRDKDQVPLITQENRVSHAMYRVIFLILAQVMANQVNQEDVLPSQAPTMATKS